ncbi:MAG TPA: hypothetical protein VGD60_00175 [Candidatus Acidoferrales bacterium]
MESYKWLGLLIAAAFVFGYVVQAYQPPHYWYRVFDAPNFPTIMLVFIGIGATWAALRTLRSLERQVEAQVNSERAWMEVEIELDTLHAITELTQGQSPTNTVVSLTINWMNVGRTPAWINLTQISMMMLKSETEAPVVSPTPGEPSVIGPQMVGANKTFEQSGDVKAEGILDPGRVGLIYGEVSYFDIFKAYHTTTFGFIVDHTRRVRRLNFMYAAYNVHT